MKDMFDIGDPCECGAVDWRVTTTLIECNGCGRIWGRVNGQWVIDPESVPKPKPSEEERRQNARDELESRVRNAVAEVLYYGRKEDEDLSVADVEDLIESGFVTVSDLAEWFKDEAEKQVPKNFKVPEEGT